MKRVDHNIQKDEQGSSGNYVKTLDMDALKSGVEIGYISICGIV